MKSLFTIYHQFVYFFLLFFYYFYILHLICFKILLKVQGGGVSGDMFFNVKWRHCSFIKMVRFFNVYKFFASFLKNNFINFVITVTYLSDIKPRSIVPIPPPICKALFAIYVRLTFSQIKSH